MLMISFSYYAISCVVAMYRQQELANHLHPFRHT